MKVQNAASAADGELRPRDRDANFSGSRTGIGARPAWPEDAETRRLLSIPSSLADLAW